MITFFKKAPRGRLGGVYEDSEVEDDEDEEDRIEREEKNKNFYRILHKNGRGHVAWEPKNSDIWGRFSFINKIALQKEKSSQKKKTKEKT